METKCFVCGAPWHPSTGGLHGTTPFCGRCERELVQEMKERQGRGLSPHAFPPPPATNRRWRFNLWPPTPTERENWFQTPMVEVEEVSIEAAFQKVSIPTGSRLLCCMEVV